MIMTGPSFAVFFDFPCQSIRWCQPESYYCTNDYQLRMCAKTIMVTLLSISETGLLVVVLETSDFGAAICMAISKKFIIISRNIRYEKA